MSEYTKEVSENSKADAISVTSNLISEPKSGVTTSRSDLQLESSNAQVDW